MNVIDHYDKLIEENNDLFHDMPELQSYMEKWDGKAFIDAMKLERTKSVLEIGVGTGRLAAKVAPHCRELTGIDISPKTIGRAKENLADHKNITLICSDFVECDFCITFDVVYSSLTMMHFEDKKQIIEKVAALLRDDGIFCLSIDKNQSEYIDMGTRKIRIFPDTPENIISLVKESSMSVTDTFETEFANIIVCKKTNN